ncbi:MAG: DUF177 domain-containing protein [Silicimonas sp.]|nr:DUF177 domain-containing protein [Silicimonas sp.]
MSQPDGSREISPRAVHEPQSFDLRTDAEERARLADEMGIRAVKKLTFAGQVAPENARDLLLTAKLGATVVQSCGVTGEPVTTRIDEPVTRRYLADLPEPEADEMEMPEDDSAEPLPAVLDLSEVMAEALALALPPWPRAEGVAPVDITVTEPGKTPLAAEDLKPFAGLKDLARSLKNNGEDQG